jgi:hypothetical protein
VDIEVSRTLAELERKLQELEQALAAASHSEQQRSMPGPARLVDEGLQTDADPRRTGDGMAPETAPQPPAGQIRVGNAEQPSHDFGESIELSELVRFRDRLQRTLRELTEDYEQIICLRGASTQQPPRSGGH